MGDDAKKIVCTSTVIRPTETGSDVSICLTTRTGAGPTVFQLMGDSALKDLVIYLDSPLDIDKENVYSGISRMYQRLRGNALAAGNRKFLQDVGYQSLMRSEAGQYDISMPELVRYAVFCAIEECCPTDEAIDACVGSQELMAKFFSECDKTFSSASKALRIFEARAVKPSALDNRRVQEVFQQVILVAAHPEAIKGKRSSAVQSRLRRRHPRHHPQTIKGWVDKFKQATGVSFEEVIPKEKPRKVKTDGESMTPERILGIQKKAIEEMDRESKGTG